MFHKDCGMCGINPDFGEVREIDIPGHVTMFKIVGNSLFAGSDDGSLWSLNRDVAVTSSLERTQGWVTDITRAGEQLWFTDHTH